VDKLDAVRKRLEEAGHTPQELKVNDTQTQIWVPEIDAIANVWSTTGTCNVQGREQAALEALLGDLVGRGGRRGSRARRVPSGSPAVTTASGPKKVFVVYGHDRTALDQLANMLRRWDLEPLILEELPSGGNTIIEKLEHYQEGVGWGVVLLTPDDLGYPALDPSGAAPRPRQNVVLEMGMLLGKLGRQHVTMLYKASDPKMELPSDINGYIYIPFQNDVRDAGQQLAKEMGDAEFHTVPVTKL
jgi:predicted nucleotide-binding protein